jgi:hypothetical protein
MAAARAVCPEVLPAVPQAVAASAIPEEAMRLSLALVSVTTMAAVAFAIGYVFGQFAGRRQARIAAFNACIDWAALAMKGNPVWRRLSVADALLKAGTLIGGDDVMPAASAAPVAALVSPPPVFTKGNQV